MADRTELKRLAEACGNLNWRFLQENWTEYAIRDDHGYIATMRVKSAKQPGPDSDREVKAKFLGAMTPTVVLELIAENDRFKSDLREMTKFKEHMVELRETHGFDSWSAALVEVDRLKAENEALRNALAECINSLKGEMLQKFGGQLPEDMHPVMRREYDRDVAELYGYRAALGKGDQS